eukprot:scaffold17491_cov114-Isochrysis_galbana.AAC.4
MALATDAVCNPRTVSMRALRCCPPLAEPRLGAWRAGRVAEWRPASGIVAARLPPPRRPPTCGRASDAAGGGGGTGGGGGYSAGIVTRKELGEGSASGTAGDGGGASAFKCIGAFGASPSPEVGAAAEPGLEAASGGEPRIDAASGGEPRIDAAAGGEPRIESAAGGEPRIESAAGGARVRAEVGMGPGRLRRSWASARGSGASITQNGCAGPSPATAGLSAPPAAPSGGTRGGSGGNTGGGPAGCGARSRERPAAIASSKSPTGIAWAGAGGAAPPAAPCRAPRPCAAAFSAVPILCWAAAHAASCRTTEFNRRSSASRSVASSATRVSTSTSRDRKARSASRAP